MKASVNCSVNADINEHSQVDILASSRSVGHLCFVKEESIQMNDPRFLSHHWPTGTHSITYLLYMNAEGIFWVIYHLISTNSIPQIINAWVCMNEWETHWKSMESYQIRSEQWIEAIHFISLFAPYNSNPWPRDVVPVKLHDVGTQYAARSVTLLQN